MPLRHPLSVLGAWALCLLVLCITGVSAAADRLAAATEAYGEPLMAFLQVAPGLCVQLFNVAPLPTLAGVVKSGSTGSLPLLPYAMMVCNGYLWMMYGAKAGDQTLVYANFPGCVLGIVYTLVCIKYRAPGTAVWQPVLISAALSALVTGLAGLPQEQAIDGIGIVGCAVVVVMFSGPLSVIQSIIADKSTAALPFPSAVATFLNCVLWTAYGGAIRDVYIWGPNILGLASAVVQLSLFCVYGFAPRVEPSDKVL